MKTLKPTLLCLSLLFAVSALASEPPTAGQPQGAKKYMTYNKPVKAYYIEYKGNDGTVIEAYENHKYTVVESESYGRIVRHTNAKGDSYSGFYQSGQWEQDDEQYERSWEGENEYPLNVFAACVTKHKGAKGFLGYGMIFEVLVHEADRFDLPNQTDVSELYLKSETVCNILCDVFRLSETSTRGTETWTFWVDPATGFTLKYERITHEGKMDSSSYEVTKLLVGPPEWDKLQLQPAK